MISVMTSSTDPFREYVLEYFGELNHGHGGASQVVDAADLEGALDIFESTLVASPSPRPLQGIDTHFYSAFHTYLRSARSELGNLLNSVDRLSNLIDPFLKKIALHFLDDPTITVPTRGGGTRRIRLSTTPNYGDVLEALGIVRVSDLYRNQVGFWRDKSADVSIIRRGFSLRHQGTHEARIHTLYSLEEAAYFVIGQYIVICLHILRNPAIEEKVKSLTERTRVTYLLKEKVRAFSLTGTLLSRREHTLVYKHRSVINPDAREKKYLFLNQLAERGPSGYWLSKERPLLSAWAKQYWDKPTDDIVRRSAGRFLLNHGEKLPLSDLMDIFASYAHKAELARWIGICATPSDRSLLVGLVNNKREEVALAALRALPLVVPRLDEEVIQMARSRSIAKTDALRNIIANLAKPAQLSRYRTFRAATRNELRVVYIYCLGEVGSIEDAKTLMAYVSGRRISEAVRVACQYAVVRIWSRFAQSRKVSHALRTSSSLLRSASLEAVERKGFGKALRAILRLVSRDARSFEMLYQVSHTLYRVAEGRDREQLKTFIRVHKISNRTRDALLALCRVGKGVDCKFVFDLIGVQKTKVDLYNHIRVATAIAQIAGKDLRHRLTRWIKCPEFWEYIPLDKPRGRSRLPIRSPENQALIRRIIATCFLHLAKRGDLRLVKRLTIHNYDWIAESAAAKFAEIAKEKDIESLIEHILAVKNLDIRERAQPVEALIALDQRLASV